MPGTVKSGLLPDTDRSHKCDSQEKVCLFINSLLDKGHFITGLKCAGQVEIGLYRRVTAAERESAVRFSLELLHIPDPDPHIGILRREICSKPGFQVFFHLFQKLLVIHLTSSWEDPTGLCKVEQMTRLYCLSRHRTRAIELFC